MTTRLFSIPPAFETYLYHTGLREHTVMRALREATQKEHYGKMQTLPEEALLLQFLAKMLNVRRYLEIGVFTGYSTLAVALGMPKEGKIIGCDMRPDFAEIAKAYWEKAEVAHKITLFLQPALDTLASLSKKEPFDLIYIDADKANYPQYYEYALSLLRENGVMALDNTLLKGHVVESSFDEPLNALVLRELNLKIHDDTRVEMILLPLGDGLTLVRKI